MPGFLNTRREAPCFGRQKQDGEINSPLQVQAEAGATRTARLRRRPLQRQAQGWGTRQGGEKTKNSGE